MPKDKSMSAPAADTLNREVIRSELKRALFTAAVLAVFVVVVLTISAIPGLMRPEMVGAFSIMKGPAAAVLLGAAFYELGVWLMLRRLLRAGRPLSKAFSYINACIETAIPTLVIMIMVKGLGALPALLAPVQLYYFILISLAILQLDGRICLFTGLVAMAQYLVLVFLYIEPTPPAEGLEYLVSRHQYVVRGLMLIIAGLVCAFVAYRARYQLAASIRTVQERDKAISIFGQHVSPQVAEKLLNQPAESVGEEKDVCIMFLDIRDFSKIAAQKTPSEVMEYLNTLFSFMIEVVNEHNGIVNKFLGDGFMAVFGAPVEDASPGDNALRSSREILRRVAELNESKAIPPTRLGIGLHLGRAITGSVGSDERKEYTIIGDAVNLAARIEQATKQFKAMLLVSEALWSAVDHDVYQAKDLGLVELKGQSQATRLYQID